MIEIPGYKLHKCMHEGLSTHVYQAIRTNDNHPVIIKVSTQKVATEKRAQRFHHEFEIGQQISSPYVVRYLELKQDPAYGVALIMDDNQMVELNSMIPEQGFSNAEFLALAIPIVEGLQAIHAANIVHNDLKLSNILIQPRILTATAPTETESLGVRLAKVTEELADHFSAQAAARTIKIIDFDQASFLRQEMLPAISTHPAMETLAYLSPEQTGRINRSVDYRTDFYSLGIVFYRLLCGQLPFMATDALGLIHQHLAKQPLPPHQRKSTIALPLSQLVVKLLEKEAENRYQSCEGILSDLQHCLKALCETGTISEFKLAQQDVANKLTLSQHLYGRDSEINILLQTFDRVSQGGREALMVAGHPGVGKSKLIQEIQKSITLKNGYFLSGKFELLNRNVAYSALSQAFEGLIKQLLTESEARIAEWKQRLLKVLGNQAQLVVQVVPSLVFLIGPQPSAQIADPSQAKTMFNLVFLDFMKLFADVSHPLVLFLDDLQWADNASLELMTYLLTQPGVRHVLWLGAYRNTEVNDAHPALQAFAQLKEADITLQTLTLIPLSLHSLQQWIAESLRMPSATIQPLAELIHQKTAGNPFFVKVFLQALYDEQLLSFSPKTHWQWDLTKIRQHPATENVITLMTYQIQQLPAATREALIMASCLGHRLAFSTLQIALASSREMVRKALHPALNCGILLQTEDEIRFAHDRVQEAAYHLVAQTEKARTHLIAGQRLFVSPAGEEALLFDTVAQFNHCYALITEPSERLRIARLNLKAAQKAKQATTYVAALAYFQAGQNWIDPKALWNTDYSLAFTWQRELAEVEYLSGHFEVSEALIKNMQPYLRSTLDKVDMFHIHILQKILQGQHQEAIALGDQALQLLGSALPLDNLTEFIEKTEVELKQKLSDRTISSLINMPLVDSSEKRAIFKILGDVQSACYLIGSELYSAAILMPVNLSLTYGHAPESCHSYAAYGLMLCFRFEEYALGYQFGSLAIDLAKKLRLPVQHCKSSMIMWGGVSHWSKPIQQLPVLLTSTYEAALDCGELEYAGYCGSHKVEMLFHQGVPLVKVQQEALPLLQFAQNTKHQNSIDTIQAVLRLLANLRGETLDEWSFEVDTIADAKFEECCQQANSFWALCTYHIRKAQIFYLYNDYKQALDNLTLAKKNLTCILGQYATAIFNWMDSLTRLALYPHLSAEDQRIYLQQVVQNQQQMAKWQTSCPENFAHKYLLVEAELAWIKGNQEQAEKLYDQAIDLAQHHGFTQEHALAAELAVQYYLARGKSIAAQGYLNIAFNGYKQWGAKRKVGLLKTRYADLLQALSPSSLSQIVVNQETTLSGNTLRLLDFSSILKASQAISSEIELPKLLHSMMQLIIENAGAQKAALLFVEADGTIFVQAEYAPDGTLTTLQKIPLAEWKNGAHAVIQYVKRLHQPMVVDDAIIHEQFKIDPYINRTQTKSILCIPILKHAALKALLYAENNLLSHAFTAERVQTVLILTAQMAISLENARYFAEQIALTKQLTTQSARLEEALLNRKREMEFIDTLCHELRNPLNGIYGNVDLLLKNQTKFETIIKKTETAGELKPELKEQLLEYVSCEKEAIKAIDKCARYQRIVTDDVRDFNQLVGGKLILSEKKFDPKKVIRDVVAMLEADIKLKKLQFHLNLPDQAISIKSDPDRIAQVLMNLLSNAVKFTPEKGEITLSLRQIVQADGSAFLQFFVKDTGIGISVDEKAKLFDRFFQAGRRTCSEYESSGLGLAISKNLVELMGGKIEVESEKHQGSQFTFTVTCKNTGKEETHVLTPQFMAIKSKQVFTAGLRILIVEDNLVNQKILNRQLEQANYECYVANNGKEALAIFEKHPVDIIFMDIEMPVMNGLEATKAIRILEKSAEWQRPVVLIIGLSGNVRPEQIDEAIKSGMDDYLTKPYERRQLLNKIMQYTKDPKLVKEHTSPVSHGSPLSFNKLTS